MVNQLHEPAFDGVLCLDLSCDQQLHGLLVDQACVDGLQHFLEVLGDIAHRAGGELLLVGQAHWDVLDRDVWPDGDVDGCAARAKDVDGGVEGHLDT